MLRQNRTKNLFLFLILSSITIIIFKSWFVSSVITGGDFWYQFPSMYSNRSIFQFAWDWNAGNGLGGSASSLAWVNLVYAIPITLLGRIFSLSWESIERIGFLFPYIFITLFSSIYLAKRISKKSLFVLIAPIIFIFNSYILQLTAGGQIVAVGLAYAITPLVFACFLNIIDFFPIFLKKNSAILKSSLIAGIVFSVQVLFDIRIAFITIISIILLALFKFFLLKKNQSTVTFGGAVLIIPLTLTVLLQAFWVLPVIIMHQNPATQLGLAQNSLESVKFFSFAKFENALGLLHPNWPENIFGLVHFMRPEFLVFPLLAFSSLFFIGKQKKREDLYVVYFTLLALLGIFLAKGANEPFGGVYLWLFNHFPGFIMFRDPTKWYLLIALSYSMLIPYTLSKIYSWFESKEKFSIFNYQFSIKSKYFNFQNLLITLFILFWMFTIQQAVFGQLGGTFRQHTVPQEYVTLEKFLSTQNIFSRTFWVPSVQRYGFYSSTHPAVSAEDFYHVSSPSGVLDNLKKQGTENILQDAGVKYVIVPFDSEGELFVTDRKYDKKMYSDIIASISAIPWLTRANGFGKIAVFQVPNPKDHFWLLTKDGKEKQVLYTFINPTEYQVSLQHVEIGDQVIFSESYDSHWEARFTNQKIASKVYKGLFNSFVLPRTGAYMLTIAYGPQKWVNIGMVISGISLISVFCLLSFLFIRHRSS